MGVLLLLISLASAQAKLNYENILENYPVLSPNNVSNAELMVDLATFISDFGIRRTAKNMELAKTWNRRTGSPELNPTRSKVNNNILNLMKQVVYGTQGRIRDITPVAEKYRGDIGFRMAFIYNRLQQLVIDIRRIYTLNTKKVGQLKLGDHIRLYQHATRKHIDILYVVETMLELHEGFLQGLLDVQNKNMKDRL